jgi:hypothetical protein
LSYIGRDYRFYQVSGVDYRNGREGGEAGGADAGGWTPSLREREKAAAREGCG